MINIICANNELSESVRKLLLNALSSIVLEKFYYVWEDYT
jgi:hypothetical protein